MNNISQIYIKLDSGMPQHEKERLFIAYVKEKIANLPNNNERQRAAYEIAGLMSTKFAAALAEGSAIDEILGLAGELEVRADNDKWRIFIQLVDAQG